MSLDSSASGDASVDEHNESNDKTTTKPGGNMYAPSLPLLPFQAPLSLSSPPLSTNTFTTFTQTMMMLPDMTRPANKSSYISGRRRRDAKDAEPHFRFRIRPTAA